MSTFKTIMVALDLTETDLTLIQYAEFIAKRSGAEKVYFMHVAHSLIDIDDTHDDPIDEEMKAKMEAEVKNYFDGNGVEAEFKVVEGNPLEKLLHWAVIKEVDLIIVGRKSVSDGSGIIVERLARKAPCTLLLVPHGKEPALSHIVAGTDHSAYSARSLELVASLITDEDNATIVCKNVYHVPIGYYKLGKSYEEFAEIMLGHAQARSEEFFKNLDTGQVKIESIFVLDDDRDVAKDLIGRMEEGKYDLAVIGSKGRTNASAMLLGSVAEKLIRNNYNTPLLVVKKKGENMTFLQSLLQF